MLTVTLQHRDGGEGECEVQPVEHTGRVLALFRGEDGYAIVLAAAGVRLPCLFADRESAYGFALDFWAALAESEREGLRRERSIERVKAHCGRAWRRLAHHPLIREETHDADAQA